MYPINVSFPRKLLAASIAAALFSHAAQADTETATIQLDTLYVVGEATSGMDDLIEQEELEKTQPNTLSDVFRHDPNVSVGGSVSMSQKIYVRDIGEDLLNISVDGAEQAASTFHHEGRVSLEPELLKQVEVESGAGSATAGFGALGGSVRFVTKDPEDLLEEDKNIGALLKSTYSSNGDSLKNSVTVYGRDDDNKYSGMVSLMDSSANDLEDGDGNKLEGTESDNQLGYAKFSMNIDESQKLTLSHERLTEEGDILYKPEQFYSSGNPASPTEGDRDTTILNYTYNPLNNEAIDLSVNLYSTENTKTRYSSKDSDTIYGGIKSFGTTIENKSFLGIHQFIYGLNFRDDESDYGTYSSSTTYGESGQVSGIYLQDIIDLTDKLIVTGGARFDYYELDDRNGLSLTDSGVSPNLSANYELSPTLSMSAGYAQALRGATTIDAFKLSAPAYSNDADLKAETAHNTELALDYKKNALSVTGGLYRTIIEDLIKGAAPWSSEYYNSEDDIKSTGFFLRANYQLDRLQLGMSFKTSNTTVDDEVATRYAYSSSAVSIGDTIILDANYKITDTFEAGWSMEHVASIDDINLYVSDGTYSYDLEIDKPSYTVHDIYARWTPATAQDLTLSLTISNLFNEQYISHASLEDFTESDPAFSAISGSAEAGRDVRITAAYKL